MRFSRTARVIAVTALISAALAGASAASTPIPPDAGTARLYGTFVMSGRVTAAGHIRGERRGQRVTRVWTFSPTCPSGSCPQTILVRSRLGSGAYSPRDQLTLTNAGNGRYIGQGLFYVPLRCQRRVIQQGEAVPFTIELQVTVVQPIFGVPFATQISATYTNHRRINLTRCVAVPGRDAASYTGAITSGG